MSKRKLLLADDSITIQKVVNLTFADEGIEVIAVGDGNSAMDKIREESPDLIMVDVNMPGLNGYEICEKVRQSDEYKSIPVILLVGSFEPFDEAEAKRVGADDFLKKPFQSISQLVNTVTVLLDSESVAAYGEPAEDISDGTDDADDEEFYGMNTTPVAFSDSKIDDELIETSHSPTEQSGFGVDPDITEEFTDAEPNEVGVAEETDLSDEDFKEFSIVGSNETPEVAEEAPSQYDLESSESAYSVVPDDSYDTDLSDYDSDDDTESAEFTNDSGENSSEDASIAEPSFAETEVRLDETNLLELPIDENVDFATESVEDMDLTTDSQYKGSQTTDEEQRDAYSDESTSHPEIDEFVDQQPEVQDLEEDTSAAFVDEHEQVEHEHVEHEQIEHKYVDHEQVAHEHVDIDHSETEPEPESEFETNGDSTESSGITPELIEEISRRVVAHLSGDALRDVAREIVPELAEKIIRQIAEEKMND